MWSTEYHRTHLRRTHFLVVRGWMVYHSLMDVNALQLFRNLIFQPLRHAGTFCFFALSQVGVRVISVGLFLYMMRYWSEGKKASMRLLYYRNSFFFSCRELFWAAEMVQVCCVDFIVFCFVFLIQRIIKMCCMFAAPCVTGFAILWFLYQKLKLRLQDILNLGMMN